MNEEGRKWMVGTLQNLILNIESGCDSEFVLDKIDDVRLHIENEEG